LTAWAGRMDFGVVHPLAFPECRSGEGPVLETLQEIVEDAWFGAVEIAPVRDPKVREQTRTLLAAASVQVVYLPILPIIFEELRLGSEDAEGRKVAKALLRESIDQAISFDAPLAMVTGPRDPESGSRRAVVARLVEDLQELCDYADAQSRRQRLHLTFENFDRDVEKRRLIGPTAEAVALAEAVDRDNFGLTIDLSHLPLLKETPAEALRMAAPHLIHAHIGNCVTGYPESVLYGDFHPRFGHPEGCNDLPEVVEFIRQLHAVGYWEHSRSRLGTMPILSVEVKPVVGESGATVLANGKRVFARAWGLAQQ
jgi:sugar phosphate isomerase/epimerase